MKKLLSLIGAIGLSSTGAGIVVSCGKPTADDSTTAPAANPVPSEDTTKPDDTPPVETTTPEVAPPTSAIDLASEPTNAITSVIFLPDQPNEDLLGEGQFFSTELAKKFSQWGIEGAIEGTDYNLSIANPESPQAAGENITITVAAVAGSTKLTGTLVFTPVIVDMSA